MKIRKVLSAYKMTRIARPASSALWGWARIWLECSREGNVFMIYPLAEVLGVRNGEPLGREK